MVFAAALSWSAVGGTASASNWREDDWRLEFSANTSFSRSVGSVFLGTTAKTFIEESSGGDRRSRPRTPLIRTWSKIFSRLISRETWLPVSNWRIYVKKPDVNEFVVLLTLNTRAPGVHTGQWVS